MLPKAFLFLVPVMDAISLYPDSFHWTSQCSHSPATGNYRQLKFTVAPFYKKLPLTKLELLGQPVSNDWHTRDCKDRTLCKYQWDTEKHVGSCSFISNLRQSMRLKNSPRQHLKKTTQTHFLQWGNKQTWRPDIQFICESSRTSEKAKFSLPKSGPWS